MLKRCQVFIFETIGHSLYSMVKSRRHDLFVNTVGPPPPPTPRLLLKAAVGLPKIESLRELRNFLLERGDKSETWKGGVDVEIGGWHFFMTLQFNHIYSVCVWGWGSKVPFITFWIFSPLALQDSHLFKSVCTFLIHSGSLQKMLTALSNFVWNTQKS